MHYRENEEQHLARCLSSAKPTVDEMIIVDTGSTDRTKRSHKPSAPKSSISPGRTTFLLPGISRYPRCLVTGSLSTCYEASLDYTTLARIVKKKPAKPVAYSMATTNYTNEVSSQGWIGMTLKIWQGGGRDRLVPEPQGPTIRE